ncbi:scoloptoxin SSD14-like isoform X2 [Argiope bruennichi]|uniref:Scoloptoxin SSD14 like protein n=1 Tax=Argiope bruennichi TaxID=94029 RepID=A0A8T0EVB9_ARGBR|nr:scoloptoxin SSD14-like isoform X2 [Argiope bruennichi]KAF8778245.1 Scoloptoxin SSD14 like protein [Argiope bruennichi]
MVNVVAPFGVQKWEIGTKEDAKLRRSLTTKAKAAVIVAFILVVLIIAVFVVCFFLPKQAKTYWFPQYESASKLGKYHSAAVSTDAAPCAVIGKDILEKNGTAVDAAIAVLLCMGVVNPQSAGIGGGFIMLYYNRTKQSTVYIDARETAPSEATEDMFHGNATLAQFGGLAIAVPGEIKGYEDAHDKFGSLPWADLFQPTIKMCREGIRVNAHLARALSKKAQYINQYEHIKKIFTNNATGELYKLDDVYTRPDLADTLEAIAANKSTAIYGNVDEKVPLATAFLKDLRDAGSIINEYDMISYAPIHRIPITKTLRNNMTLHSVSTPGSGALLAFMLGVLSGYEDLNAEVVKSREATVKTLHRMIETFKYAYAQRMYFEDSTSEHMRELESKLVSEEYADKIRSQIDDTRTFNDMAHYGVNVTVQEDHGTAHLSIIAPNGDAVSVTSTVNAYFGSMVLSPSTGILMNNEMDDFSSPNITNSFDVPPTKMNHVVPGRRPFSSMSPAIITDANGDVVLTIGGNGGTQITTSVAQTIIKTLWLGENIKQAIDAPRFHHQLAPNYIEHEERFPKDLLEDLGKMGHKLHLLGSGMLGIIMGVIRGEDGYVYANSDYRKGGDVDGF